MTTMMLSVGVLRNAAAAALESQSGGEGDGRFPYGPRLCLCGASMAPGETGRYLGGSGSIDGQPLSLLPGEKLIVFIGPESVWVDKEEEWYKAKAKAQVLESG